MYAAAIYKSQQVDAELQAERVCGQCALIACIDDDGSA